MMLAAGDALFFLRLLNEIFRHGKAWQ